MPQSFRKSNSHTKKVIREEETLYNNNLAYTCSGLDHTLKIIKDDLHGPENVTDLSM